ncbi:uncharacterized protein [Rutidosis leptorrhynchoides]|uniref:uncharacterized protein n=1 Tax=Rutidosis leptorrhynchoides TaxID=125765 RepID=UPI003A9A320A
MVVSGGDEMGFVEGGFTNNQELVAGREEWAWSWSNDGLFTVIRLTDILVRTYLVNQTSATMTLRNIFVPLKVELFIWRARLKRLPTMVELDKRGMDLGTVRCPVCDNGLETVEHSIILCNFALDIWKRVFDWWNLGPYTNMSINESFMGDGHSFTSVMGKQLWQATEWVTGYMIWKSINATVFSKAKSTSAMVFKEVQIKSFEWFSDRIKGISIEWDPYGSQICGVMTRLFYNLGDPALVKRYNPPCRFFASLLE